MLYAPVNRITRLCVAIFSFVLYGGALPAFSFFRRFIPRIIVLYLPFFLPLSFVCSRVAHCLTHALNDERKPAFLCGFEAVEFGESLGVFFPNDTVIISEKKI